MKLVRCLTIAGSDSGGGAGVQTDLKTFSALDCFGMSAITAVTAQSTTGVTGIFELPPRAVAEQIAAVLSDIGADAMKVGMLQNAAVVAAVVEALRDYPFIPLVVDPVMIAKGGATLLKPEAVRLLCTELLPRALVVTPNLPEVQAIVGRAVATPREMEEAARSIHALGPVNVVMKGGHAGGDESSDLLYLGQEERCVWLRAPRIDTPNTHGTGCTFSAAITAYLAHGRDVESAVRLAKGFLTDALERGLLCRLGKGHGPALIAGIRGGPATKC